MHYRCCLHLRCFHFHHQESHYNFLYRYNYQLSVYVVLQRMHYCNHHLYSNHIQTLNDSRHISLAGLSHIVVYSCKHILHLTKTALLRWHLLHIEGFCSISSIIQDMFLSVVADIWLRLRCTYVASKQMMISRAIKRYTVC
jgi:hypothetical protein